MNREQAIDEIRQVLILNEDRKYLDTSSYFEDTINSFYNCYWYEGSRYLPKFIFESYDNAYYVGEIRNGLKNGHGAHKFANGDFYIGEWEDGKRTDDESFLFFSNGNIYLGDFNDGVIHGSGILYLRDGGKILRGKFENGKYMGTNPNQKYYISGF